MPGSSSIVQFLGVRRFAAKLPAQRCIEPLRDKRFSDVEHIEITPEKLGNLGIRFVGMGQDVDMPDRGGRGFVAVNEAFEERTLVVGEGNGVLVLPHESNTQHISILVL